MDKKFKIQFARLRDNIWRDPTLSPGAKVILLDLLFYAGVNDNSFPSEEKLAINHDFTARHVRNLLKELQKRNLIEWERGGFGRSNHYFFNTEIYCLTEDPQDNSKKSISSNLGNQFPVSSGNPVPTNIVSNKYSQSNNSQHDYIKNETKFPCGLNGCNSGWIIDSISNIARKCECRIRYEQEGGRL